MRILRLDRLEEASAKHADAQTALTLWTKCTQEACWNSIRDVRQTYPHADAVKMNDGSVATIFNIRGNRYRLAVSIDYSDGIVNVLRLMTHSEYDKQLWKGRS